MQAAAVFTGSGHVALVKQFCAFVPSQLRPHLLGLQQQARAAYTPPFEPPPFEPALERCMRGRGNQKAGTARSGGVRGAQLAEG